MAHLYKASEWEVAGKWYIADTSDLGNDSAAWWIPARIIGISLTDYILLLQNEYHAIIDKYCPNANNNKSLLIFHWDSYTDAHRYLLYINRIARNKNWTI